MASRVYQYVINLVVSLPIQRGLSVLMNITVWEHSDIKNQSFHSFPDVDSLSQLSV